MKRGTLVTAVLPGDYGKPRPCLVVQSDHLAALDSVLLCPITSDTETAGPLRVTVAPTEANGLKTGSVIMVDKLTAVARTRCRDNIGFADPDVMREVDARIAFVAGLAE